MTQKKKNGRKKEILIGAAAGLLIGLLSSRMIKVNNNGFADLIIMYVLFIIGLSFSFVVHIIAHEAGHLIFGLLTSYRFNSFRIFKYQFIKENGKLIVKQYSLAGTAGQCLMEPPEKDKDGKFPYILYNLGGVIINLLLTIITTAISFSITNQYVDVFLFSASAVGLFCAITNGIPLNYSEIPNDGYNALSLGKDKYALNSFWTQLKVVSLQAKETRLKDMPAEYFELSDAANKQNVINSTITVFKENRLMDEHKFDEAYELINRLLSDEYKIVGIYNSLLIIDKLYIEAILGKVVDKSVLETKEFKIFLKQMKNFLSVIRTNYVLSLIVDKDITKANEYKKQFESVSVSYPNKVEIESELELIRIAKKDNKYCLLYL